MIGGINTNNGFQNQTGSGALNQNTTHEHTYEEDSKAIDVIDQVVSLTQEDDDEENELGSDNHSGYDAGAKVEQGAHLKFIASLKSELASAKALIDKQKAQMLALVMKTRAMNNELKQLRATSLLQREISQVTAGASIADDEVVLGHQFDTSEEDRQTLVGVKMQERAICNRS